MRGIFQNKKNKFKLM